MYKSQLGYDWKEKEDNCFGQILITHPLIWMKTLRKKKEIQSIKSKGEREAKYGFSFFQNVKKKKIEFIVFWTNPLTKIKSCKKSLMQIIMEQS